MRKSSSSNPLMEIHTGTANTSVGGCVSSESYSSSSSEFSGSYSNSSDLANWEEHVGKDGILFYAEYLPQNKSNATQSQTEFSRSSLLRGNKKSSTKNKTTTPAKQINSHSQFKISAIKSASNFKELDLVITAADRYRFGRRSSAVESILGFRVIPFVDRPECLMVESFVHDMPAMQQGTEQQIIKRGDWFKSLDSIEVRAENIDELLLQFIQPTKVTLKFQGPSENLDESNATNNSNEYKKIENFELFSQIFEKFYENIDLGSNGEGASATEKSTDKGIPFSFLILPLELSYNNSNQSVFYYPEDQESNFLYKARGSFLTLNAVLTQELKSTPILSILSVNGVEYYVGYRTFNQVLTITSFSALVQTRKEAALRTDEFFNYLQFTYPNLHLPFTNAEQNSIRKMILYSCDIARCRVNPPGPRQYLFEELMKESRQMALPKEAQLRIFDALSEMEAMDYRNWNDEPLNTYREFFIFGSVLYYDCYLLASQLPIEIRLGLESFLKCRGIFDFISLQNVKELYVWQEISLPNAPGRYFLTICCRGHLLLAVILKTCETPASTVTETAETTTDIIPPSLFYIEEIQETLDHLIQCGIESLATFWSSSNKRPEIEMLANFQNSEGATAEFEKEHKENRKHDTFHRQKSNSSLATVTSSNLSRADRRRSLSYDEDTQHCSSLGGGSSIHSLTPSEDDSSKRRGATSGAVDDSDSGSDWEGFGDQTNLLHQHGEGISQMTESLWKEIKNVVPVNLTAGWKNSLFYYIYIDNSNGTILCPLKPINGSFEFLFEMRQACYLIHDILQESKNLLLAESENSSKSSSIDEEPMIIKEHGVTIKIDENPDNPTSVSGVFVIVGRLFLSPPREVYICHHPDVPQNMLEMAFRLSFLGLG